MKRRVVLTGMVLAAAGIAAAPAPVVVDAITLYIPENLFSQRIGGDVDTFVAYYNRLKPVLETGFAGVPQGPGMTGVLVVMVRPDGKSQSWIAARENALPSDFVEALTRAADAVPAFSTRGERVLFGVAFSAWGGGEAPVGWPIPLPREWLPLFSNGGRLDDAMMKRIWPD